MCWESREALPVARQAHQGSGNTKGSRCHQSQHRCPAPISPLLSQHSGTCFPEKHLRYAVQSWERRSRSWPRSLRGNASASEALGAAACSLKSRAGALNKSALDCFKVCRNLFVARGACNKGVWEWKAGQPQLCVAMDINSLNQGICGGCRDSQMVLEYQLKRKMVKTQLWAWTLLWSQT